MPDVERLDDDDEEPQLKDLPRDKQTAIATALIDSLTPISEKLSELDEIGMDSDDDDLTSSAATARDLVDRPVDEAGEFRNRRISWSELGLEVKEGLEDLEFELEISNEIHAKVRPLFEQAIPLLRTIFRQMTEE